MDEPSPGAREVIAAYRRAARMSASDRARLWNRLQDSIADGDDRWIEAGVGSEGASPRGPRRNRTIALMVLAVAALLLLAWSRLRPQTATPENDASPDAAVHDVAPNPTEDGTASRVDDRGGALRPAPAPEARDEASAATEATAPEPLPRSHRRSTPRATSEVPAAGGPDLARETKLLRAARHALEAGDPDEALTILARHERAFGSGQLREDRMALRIEALCAAGKTAQGRGEARAFADAFPRSHHADRIAKACDS